MKKTDNTNILQNKPRANLTLEIKTLTYNCLACM